MEVRRPEGRQDLSAAYLVLGLLISAAVGISLAAVWIFDHASAGTSLFALANLVGPTTDSLLQGRGLTACTETMGTVGNPVCFHAGRMPLPSMVVALGIRLLGNSFLRVAFLKTLLLLVPLEAALYLVWRQMPRSGWRRICVVALLLAPFGITAFLANVVNLQVEEGYSYSFLALAVALLLFGRPLRDVDSDGRLGARAVFFALAVDGVYLAKSSMAPAVAVLVVGFLLVERRAMQRVVVLLLVAAAPLGWAMHQHHASGRYSIGTSLDGMNLHKANNPEFLAHYPPPPGASLDKFDPDLNRGVRFDDEWSFNDYHQKKALEYLKAHPGETLRGDVRKLQVLFVSVRKYGSTDSHGAMLLLETAGLAMFRVILWAALGGALYVLIWRRGGLGSDPLAMAGGIFLALVAACALPYVVGFAYTRHASVLIYPAALMCCRILVEE